MAISVVYKIIDLELHQVHDIIVQEETRWMKGYEISGGIRSALNEQYPSDKYRIDVSEYVSHGDISKANSIIEELQNLNTQLRAI